MSTKDEDLVERFAMKYRRPKGAFAYGVSSRELSHNSFLHFMLGLGCAFSQRLIGELIAKASNGSDEGCRVVQIRKLTYNRDEAIRGRPDEVAVVEDDSGTTSALVVEMKVQAAPVDKQLKDYTLKDFSEVHDNNTHKMFLCIPGHTGSMPNEYPVLSADEYAACIRRSLVTSPIEDDRAAFLVNDYLETLDFLCLARDAAIRGAGRLLQLRDSGDDKALSTWLQEHWRWIEKLILAEVAARLQGQLPNGWEPSSTGPGGGKKATYLNFWCGTDTIQLGESDDGAQVFFMWRMGHGFEVHAIVNDYHRKRKSSDASMKRKDALRGLCQEVLEGLWAGRKTSFRTRKGRSQRAGRLENNTRDTEEIVRIISTELPGIDARVRDAAADLPDPAST